MITMDNLLKSKEFHIGLAMGVNISLQMLLAAHERGEPLTVEGKPYHVLGGDQLLQQMIDKICT